MFENKLLFMTLIFIVKIEAKDQITRLNGGRNTVEGRIEVMRNGQWGTVCDDKLTSNVCIVICRELGLEGGQCINELGDLGCHSNINPSDQTNRYFSTFEQDSSAVPPILLDDVECTGNELRLIECKTGMEIDCTHKEDAGCLCGIDVKNVQKVEKVDRSGKVQTNNNAPNGCNRSRHRLSPFPINGHLSFDKSRTEADASATVNAGRVEVLTDDNRWGIVCDDDWDDADVVVFCKCLGYTDEQFFKAVNYPEHDSHLPVVLSKVNCSTVDAVKTKNIWECPSEKIFVEKNLEEKSKCDSHYESAGAICGPQKIYKPVIPDVTFQCLENIMTGCFKNYSQSLELLHFKNGCSQARFFYKNEQTCFEIDMMKCYGVDITRVLNFLNYCILITKDSNDIIAQFSNIILSDSWALKLCCQSNTNVSMSGSFAPLNPSPKQIMHDKITSPEISFICYRGNNKLVPLIFPVNIELGEQVKCYVNVAQWDKNMYLVVNDCFFTAEMLNGDLKPPVYKFLENRCVSSKSLGIQLYSISDMMWGFKFDLPMFAGHQELYLQCHAYICNKIYEGKRICDRSCIRDKDSKDMVFSLNKQKNDNLMTMLPIVKPNRVKKDSNKYVLKDNIGGNENKAKGIEKISTGLFHVKDSNYGPVFVFDRERDIFVVQKNFFYPKNNARIFKKSNIIFFYLLLCYCIHIIRYF